MAETRQEWQERIALSNAERKAREQEIIKGLPTLGWMAGLGLPGAGITDTLGLYPADTSGSGEMLPSFGENIANKRYLDALYQGMGLFGDAFYASIPVTGPMGVLAGTALKGASIAGKASRVRNVLPAPQRMFDPDSKAFKPFLEDFEFTKGGRYMEMGKTGPVDITGEFPQTANISVGTDGKAAFQLSPEKYDVKPELTRKDGNIVRTNLFKKKAGWKWEKTPEGYNPNPDGSFPLVSLETNQGGKSRHFYSLEADFPEGVDLARYPNKKSEPRLRPTTRGDVQLGEVVGEINVRGKNHPVYDSVTVQPRQGIAALPESDDYITAYHGSGADFDKFDIKKIGSGEGMQAFGRGLYFAEEELVGKEYQKALGTIIKYDGKTILKNDKGVGSTGDRHLDDLIIQDLGDVDKGINRLQKMVDDYPDEPWWREDLELLKGAKDKIKVEKAGKLYETKLKVTPDELLDLDKPLNKQSKVVQKKIGKILDMKLSDLRPDEYGSATDLVTVRDLMSEKWVEIPFGRIDGHTFTRFITEQNLVGPRRTSELFESVGIKGNRYKDEFSRGKEGGTSNFVIFDDRVIDISKKYGITIPMAGAMLMAEDYKNTVEAEEFNQGGEVFDPEGDGYDYVTAEKYALKPDESGHYPSRVPETGQLLKGKNHPTFHLTEREESRLGNIIFKGKDGFYYSLSENVNERLGFAGGGEVENDVSAYLRFYQYAKDAGLQFPEAVAAQASLESEHGKSDLAIYQNNVLGIKPDDSSQASESYDTLEYINGEPVVINDLFRTFDSQEDSFAGYKDKIDKPRYEDAKSSGTPEDYLMAIDEAGYATDPDYAEKVIGIMNRYNSYLEN